MSPAPGTPVLLPAVLLILALVLSAGCLSAPAHEAAPAAPEGSLVFYTEQHPPYNYVENGTLKGFSVDLLEAITERTGSKVTREQVHLVPWAEGYRTVLARNNTVLFTTVRLPERESSFKWAGPVYPHTNVLFARPDRNITITGPESLKHYRIGVITDDVAVRQLLTAGVARDQLVQETNTSAIIAKLNSGDVDLWAYPEDTGRYLARQATGNAYSFRVVYTLPAAEGYYAFNPQVPDATVRSFQEALDALKAEKDARGISPYDRILGRYIPSLGLSQLAYLTEEWAPFNYQENGTAAGISVDILDAVFRNTGTNRSRADVRIVPLAEGFRQAQAGNGTVLFSIVRTPEREPLYKWAGPFTRAGFVVFAPVKRNITIAAPHELNRYRIAAVKNSIENTLLAERGVNASQIVPGLVPDDCIRMLRNGEVDLWATGDVTGRRELQEAGLDPGAYEIVHTLSGNDFYFIFSRDVPDELVGAFSDALVAVRNQKDEQGISEYERVIYRNIGVGCTRETFTEADVMTLVNTTAGAIAQDAPGTILRINRGEAPFRDAQNPALYAFVYDTNMTVAAHADNILLVGVNTRGKPDVTGRLFHDAIRAGALRNGTGREEYVAVSPARTNLYYKTTYYRLVTGSDGKSYIVCSGSFRPCSA